MSHALATPLCVPNLETCVKFNLLDSVAKFRDHGVSGWKEIRKTSVHWFELDITMQGAVEGFGFCRGPKFTISHWLLAGRR